jgi:hypothetical protein
VTASLSIGTAYNEAAAFIRREKRLIAPLVLALLVLPVALAQLVQPANPFDGGDDSRAWFGIAAIAFLIGLVGQMAISRLAMVPNRSPGEAIGSALRRAPAVFAAFFIFGLCVSAALIPLIVIDMLVTGAGKEAGASPFLQSVSILLAFAAVPRVLVMPAMAMDEQSGPWRLLKGSWSATRGHYWRLLGFFLLFLLASQVLVRATTAVVGTFATLLIGAPQPWSVAQLLVALVVGLVQGIAGALYAAMLGRMAVQLRSASARGPGSIKGT